jgi:cytochrome c oxidase cbb3-type subunit 3
MTGSTLTILAGVVVVAGGVAVASRATKEWGAAKLETPSIVRSAAGSVACGSLACPQQSDQQAAAPGQPTTLIAHPEHVQLGLSITRPQATLINPREHDPKALEEGKVLFVSYNCADCHGSDGSGNVAPSFQDGRWHFGGTVGDVYESIEEGRPDGMPAWGGRISESQIWALVAYVRTLSAGKDVSTENFEGATVQRGGH